MLQGEGPELLVGRFGRGEIPPDHGVLVGLQIRTQRRDAILDRHLDETHLLPCAASAHRGVTRRPGVLDRVGFAEERNPVPPSGRSRRKNGVEYSLPLFRPRTVTRWNGFGPLPRRTTRVDSARTQPSDARDDLGPLHGGVRSTCDPPFSPPDLSAELLRSRRCPGGPMVLAWRRGMPSELAATSDGTPTGPSSRRTSTVSSRRRAERPRP